MEAQGQHGALADLRFDIELDRAVFERIAGITRAIHMS